MAAAIGLNQVTHRQVGEDWLMEAYLDRADGPDRLLLM
jgi:hypothetical protein